MKSQNVNYNKGVKINVLSKNTVGNKINAALSDMKELSNRFVATSLDPVRYGRFLSGYNDDSIVAKLFRDLHDGDVKREKIMRKALYQGSKCCLFSIPKKIYPKYKRMMLRNLISEIVKQAKELRSVRAL